MANITDTYSSLENVELYNEATWAVYELTKDWSNYRDSDLWISLQDGQTYTFAVRADTVETMTWGQVFTMKIENIWWTSCVTATNLICIK
jgi:hypothetical protein